MAKSSKFEMRLAVTEDGEALDISEDVDMTIVVSLGKMFGS